MISIIERKRLLGVFSFYMLYYTSPKGQSFTFRVFDSYFFLTRREFSST